ncbi:MAG TPA: selenocysteine-specific translation elongation factor [Actinomycetota bacterium]|nr:selenocysteine-specific translation elongation factor [Actinomycetota bacterium]
MSEAAPPERPLHVVATAGHVDHGKSSLIQRLTGIDPDRFEEEKRRGLTIDLGFAWLTLPSGREVGFVDVPGHERFVRNMLAGVGPVRLVLFVVAADEGWKPQSEEHLQIVDVLGAHAGVVALTKADLVDGTTLAAARDEIARRLAGTALVDAPVVACSSTTGAGLDALLRELERMVADAPAPETDGRPRLFVDRVFPVKGAGTVVTGTLTGGPLRVGDEAQLWPSGVRSRIRGLQTHKHALDAAMPVSRVAVNLAGTERAAVERGDVLGRSSEWRATETFEGVLTPVRTLGRRLSPRGAFKMHAGSAERDVRIRFLDDEPDDPVAARLVRVRLSAPLALDVFDRFVVRDAGRRETVAGGRVLDVAPPARPGDAVARLRARERADRAELPALLLGERPAARVDEVPLLTGMSPASIEGATRRGAWWIADDVVAEAVALVGSGLASFHAAQPLEPGRDLAAVRAMIAPVLRRRGIGDDDLVDVLLDAIASDAAFVRDGSILRLATHTPELAGRRDDLDAVVRAVADAEPLPPSVRDLVAAHGREVVDAAIRTGLLVRAGSDLVFTPPFVERAVAVVRTAGADGITVSRFREELGTSRRYAVPLLEHFDQRGVTIRRGDLRFATRAT